MKCKRRKIVRQIILSASVLALLSITSVYVLRYLSDKNTPESYTISAESDGVTINFGKILATRNALEFIVPLYKIGFSPNSIEKVKSSCSCTVAKIQPQDRNIHITYTPNPETVHVRQTVFVIPRNDSNSIKAIRILGELIPAWFARPSTIVLDNIYPGESRTFSADIEINYKLPAIRIKSVGLNPKTDSCVLKTAKKGENKFIIEGLVKGLPQSCLYKGTIEIIFDTGPFKTFALPIKIGHVGLISATPEIITLRRTQAHEAMVELTHFKKLPLNIYKIDHPEYLAVIPVESHANSCLLKIMIKENATLPERINPSTIKVTFEGINQPGLVRVVVISD